MYIDTLIYYKNALRLNFKRVRRTIHKQTSRYIYYALMYIVLIYYVNHNEQIGMNTNKQKQTDV